MRICECGAEATWFHQDRFWCEACWKARPVEPQAYDETVPDALRFGKAIKVLGLLETVEALALRVAELEAGQESQQRAIDFLNNVDY